MIRMGRAPCCDKANVKKGPWSPEEDEKLKSYIQNNHGTGGNWITLPHKIGLKRCGKSCRLRWLNYLRPNIKHGGFSDEEDSIICSLYIAIGSRWSIIAAQLPGRTDNDIKNHWNTKLKTMLLGKNQKNNRPRPSCNNIYHHLKSRAALMINYNADHMRQAAANAGAAAPAELLDLSATPAAAAAAAAHEAAATDYYSVLQQLPEYCSGGDHQMRQDSSLKLAAAAAAAAAADHNHALIRFPFYGAGSGGGAGDQAQLVAPSFTIPQQLQAAAMHHHHHHHEPAADPAMAAFSCMMHESASVLFNDASPPTWPNHACPAAADRDEEGYYGSTMKASGMNYFDLWNELLRSMMNSC